MLQDIFPHELDIGYETSLTAAPDDLLCLFSDEGVVISEQGAAFGLPVISDLNIRYERLQFLFRLDDRKVFTVIESFILSETDRGKYKYVPLNKFYRLYHSPKELCFALMTAYQLNNWYKDNKHCGRCGGGLVLSDKERALVCPSCGRIVYPKIVPAVIVAVTNGDSILLTSYADRPEISYALIAGFVEIGETLEQTVIREVREEAGLEVRNIKYYSSQPWGIVDNIMVGFTCELDGDPEITMDTSELKEARWVRREEIEIARDDFSLTNEMISAFREGLI